MALLIKVAPRHLCSSGEPGLETGYNFSFLMTCAKLTASAVTNAGWSRATPHIRSMLGKATLLPKIWKMRPQTAPLRTGGSAAQS